MTIINQDKVKQVPRKPDVYFFKNETGEIIYIGKAKHLRNRVRSYFQNSKYQSAKNISGTTFYFYIFIRHLSFRTCTLLVN